MKKTLVVTLALVFVLGLAGTAFANPYSDVPAGHWAYKAVTDLTKAGIVEGYQGKYRGADNMTRYEMAAITARAMAKADKADAATKATIDKLAVEFSKELNDLGVRVAKLEKNASTVKWSGDTRLRFTDADAAPGAVNGDKFGQRVRFYVNAQVSEKIDFTGKFIYGDTQEFGTQDNVSALYEAYATHKGLLGEGTKVNFGRMSQQVGQMGYYLDSTGGFDGIEVIAPMGEVTVTGVFADAGKHTYFNGTVASSGNAIQSGAANAGATDTNVTIGKIEWKPSKDFSFKGWYLDRASNDNAIYGAGLSYAFASDWKVVGDFVKEENGYKGDDATDTHIRLQYKGVNAAKPGSWGAFVEYVKWEGAMAESANNVGLKQDRKAYAVSYSTALAKNLTLDTFYTFNIKKADGSAVAADGSGETYLRAQLNYMF